MKLKNEIIGIIKMADKEQLMIDGVDILKEKINMCFILLLNKLETPETIEQTIYEHLDAFVEEWNTQLARKTQECEELKKKLMQKDEINTFLNAPIEGWSNNPCDICESKNNYEQLTQECDTLKSQLDFEVQQKECIEQECEKLKAQIETYSKMLETPEFKVALIDVRTGEREVWRKLGNKAKRYTQALDEVLSIATNSDMLPCADFVVECTKCQDRITEKGKRCMRYGLVKIKNVIEKTKDEKNGNYS